MHKVTHICTKLCTIYGDVMFITVKRGTIAAVVIAAVVLAALFCGAAAVNASIYENGLTVVIDAGHGGEDGGVVGVVTKSKESDVNLAIAEKLKAHFVKNGYSVIMTRTDSGSVDGAIKYNKKADMRARKDIIDRAQPDLLISVHCNSYPVQSVKGAQVFYAKNSEAGNKYATALQTYINAALNTKPRAAAVGDYYILNCSAFPSVLVECGFMSNPEEDRLLATDSYREKVALSVYSALSSELTLTKM